MGSYTRTQETRRANGLREVPRFLSSCDAATSSWSIWTTTTIWSSTTIWRTTTTLWWTGTLWWTTTTLWWTGTIWWTTSTLWRTSTSIWRTESLCTRRRSNHGSCTASPWVSTWAAVLGNG